MAMTLRQSIDALRATFCAACGCKKKPGFIVCYSCWDALKTGTQRRVKRDLKERPTTLPAVLAAILEELGTAFKAEAPCPLCGSLGVLIDARGETTPCPQCGETS